MMFMLTRILSASLGKLLPVKKIMVQVRPLLKKYFFDVALSFQKF